jgi:hypothetical protein
VLCSPTKQTILQITGNLAHVFGVPLVGSSRYIYLSARDNFAFYSSVMPFVNPAGVGLQ